jgi:hypothetical protein
MLSDAPARPNPDITLQPRILEHYHAASPYMEAQFGGDPIVFVNYPGWQGGRPGFVEYGVTDVPLSMAKLMWLVHREFALSFFGWVPVPGNESYVRFARLRVSGHSPNARLKFAAKTARQALQQHNLDAALVLDAPRAFTLWIPLADRPHDVTVRDRMHRICQSAADANPELFTLEPNAADPARVHLGYSQNAYHRYTILPYSLYAGYDLPMATPVPWEALDSDFKITPVTADVFSGYVALNGDAFSAAVAAIGKQTLCHPERVFSPERGAQATQSKGEGQAAGGSARLESVKTSGKHGKLLQAAIEILEDGKPRSADQLLDEAIKRNLLPPEMTAKSISGLIVEYIARTMYRGRKPQIVYGADRLFRINEPPDDWPDLVKLATPPDDDTVDALVDRLRTTSQGEDPTAFEIACCDAFAHLGFRTQHVGGHANPDGIADAELGPLAYRVMMECKSAMHYSTPHHTPSGVVYKPDVAEAAKYAKLYNADFSTLVAPDYGDNQETMSELQEHKVTAFTVDDIATLLHIRANPLEIRGVLEPGFANKVADLVWERRHGRVKRLATIAYLIQKAGWASQVASAAEFDNATTSDPQLSTDSAAPDGARGTEQRHVAPVTLSGASAASEVEGPPGLGRNAPHITVDAAMLLVDQALRDLGKTQTCSREDIEAAFVHLTDPLVGSAVWLDDTRSAIALLSDGRPTIV